MFKEGRRDIHEMERGVRGNILALFVLAIGMHVSPAIAQGGDRITTLTCGQAKVSVLNSDDPHLPFFEVRLAGRWGDKSYRLSATREYLELRCDTDVNQRHVLLVNHFCGGSACRDQDSFGIIDPATGDMLLTIPDRIDVGNGDEAEHIMGSPIKPFSCRRYGEGRAIKPVRGAYCFHSPLLLD